MKKKVLTTIAFCFLIMNIVISQSAPKTEQKKDGDVTLEMTDGTTMRGWMRTKFIGKIKYIEVSSEPKGKRVRYDNDQVHRIIFDEGAMLVKRDVYANGRGKKVYKDFWVRQDYVGNGIGVYSVLVKETTATPTMTMRSISINWIHTFKLGDDPARIIAVVWGVNAKSATRKQLVYYFSKHYPQYAELAKRIEEKEFDDLDFVKIAKVWEEMYGEKEQ